jgi:hypothetical protein
MTVELGEGYSDSVSFFGGSVTGIQRSLTEAFGKIRGREVTVKTTYLTDHGWQPTFGSVLEGSKAADKAFGQSRQMQALVDELKLLREQVQKETKPMDKIKILFVAASPRDQGRLALDEEMRLIQERITSATHRDRIEFIPIVAARPNDVLQAFNRHAPHLVHFSGHGGSNDLCLCDDKGFTKPVSHETLADLFRVMGGVQVAVFNACLSEAQAEAVRTYVPCAIGMNKSVKNGAAIAFAAAFYQAIAFGQSVQNAFDQAIWSLKAEGHKGHDIPQLLVKDGIDASQEKPVNEPCA